MFVIRFGPEDLANVRFAISPLMEVHRSAHALADPASNALHLPWISASHELVADLGLHVIHALRPTNAYSPDFVHPPPSTPLADFEDELAEMLATPLSEVRGEIQDAYRRTSVPAVLEPFIDDTRRAMADLAELLREYWRRAVEPHWERLRALMEGDVLYRARQIVEGGARRLFADIHPELRFGDDALWISKPWSAEIALDGRGLLFVPSAFVWPSLAAINKPPWQPTLVYPARGVGTLWDPERPAPPEALSALVGKRRASVLAALDSPRSTTDVALALGLSPASVSQHLAVLRDSGLVNGHRVGRVVLYARSPTGDYLAAGISDAPSPTGHAARAPGSSAS